MPEAYIVAAVRTPGGRRGGKLASWHPADLGGLALSQVVHRAGIDPAAVDDVVFGCVSQIGEQSFHIGRNAVLASSLPISVPAVSIDRQCGSSQQAIHFAAQAVLSGTQDVVIAAGVESMTRVPMGTPTRLAEEAGLGGPWPSTIRDRFRVDGFSQFTGAQMIADKYGLSRETMDRFALSSHQKAAAAIAANAFADELLPVPIPSGVHTQDEGVRPDASYEAIAGLKTLVPGGTLTAGNASQMCDGAAAVLVVGERALKDHRLTPLARIHTLTVVAGDPVTMLEEPIPGTAKALARAGLSMADIDLFEVNEAFASVVLAWQQATGADPARVNVNGGAIALGHPLGATGAKLMTTLVHALRARRGRYGLQAMCEGGGIANVTIVEAL
ncbi:acetyl-CoA C-acetyltransferase [Nitrospirillum iridis]|uniref:Acetyl-CoA C-acetyltransferase n=1 Tax=Nitrospirillum iridis TaxID=765888 RepID=A0A7X0B1K5_9PROT|nr:acetyl-CoA C-acetyltransferase [Nitrospirillum iridis]MBB6253286.1 acetyl-CoA C-acetyltransferase [Nitrospirillum iridis]